MSDYKNMNSDATKYIAVAFATNWRLPSSATHAHFELDSTTSHRMWAFDEMVSAFAFKSLT